MGQSLLCSNFGVVPSRAWPSSVLTCQSGIKYFTKNKQQKKFVLKKTSQKQNSFTVNTNKNGINHSRICVFDYKLGHLSRKFLW